MYNVISRNEKLPTSSTIHMTLGSTLFPNKLEYETHYSSKYRSRFKTSSQDMANWNTINNPKEASSGPMKVLQELKKTNLNIIKKKADMAKFFNERIKILNQDKNTSKNYISNNRKSINIINDGSNNILYSKDAGQVNKKILRERRKSYLAKKENPKFKIVLKKENLTDNLYWDEHPIDPSKYDSDKGATISYLSKEIFDKEFTLFKTKDGIDFIKNTLNTENKNKFNRNSIKAVSTISEFGSTLSPKLDLPVIKGRVSLKDLYEKYEKSEIPQTLSKTTKNYYNSIQLTKTKSKMNKTQTKNYLINTESRILSTINFGELAPQKKKKNQQPTCFTDQRPIFTKRSLSTPMGEVIGEIYNTQLKLGQVTINLENTINKEMTKYNQEFEV
jgi:hypothetical protein